MLMSTPLLAVALNQISTEPTEPVLIALAGSLTLAVVPSRAAAVSGSFGGAPAWPRVTVPAYVPFPVEPVSSLAPAATEVSPRRHQPEGASAATTGRKAVPTVPVTVAALAPAPVRAPACQWAISRPGANGAVHSAASSSEAAR